jgi:hypothetical protein
MANDLNSVSKLVIAPDYFEIGPTNVNPCSTNSSPVVFQSSPGWTTPYGLYTYTVKSLTADSIAADTVPEIVAKIATKTKAKQKPTTVPLEEAVLFNEITEVFHIVGGGCKAGHKKLRKVSKNDAVTTFNHFKDSWCYVCRIYAEEKYGSTK